MFKFKFGFFWTLFVTIILLMFICVPPEERNGVPVSFFPLLLLGLFEVIGISVLISGIKQIITDRKTSRYGEETYGKIISITGTGSYTNNVPELQAEIVTYVPSTGQVECFKEIIGFRPSYVCGDYLLLKQYEEDVNIIRKISKWEVPTYIAEKINEKFMYNGEDIVEIDGVKYKKVDDDSNYTW